uniref:Uncharacterized protein n=1 Tax=Trichobilharzia regenti TaxID=157069 RepID=A0AA85KH52_TRIRE|nr:unnamed protein product [Trichobilharzia regenti]
MMNRYTVLLITIVVPLLVQSNLRRGRIPVRRNVRASAVDWYDSFKNETLEEETRYQAMVRWSGLFNGMANRSDNLLKLAQWQVNATKSPYMKEMQQHIDFVQKEIDRFTSEE